MSRPAVCVAVANRFTRVPAGSPPLDGIQLRLLPLADVVMWLMLSRPGGLSLRTTWVTPATILLCSGVAFAAGILGVVGLSYGLSSGYVLPLIAGLLSTAAAIGCASIALYGVRQRLLTRP
jgi:hypothetical protein